jgi:DNA phosphorothioation-associated DGQHR protein 1
MSSNYPLRLRAVKVSQPMGDFYAVSMTARQLREVIFIEPTRIESVVKKSFWYRLTGNQRGSSPSRTRDIGAYINTVESAFPNSIILAGNYDDTGKLIEDEANRWRIETDDCGEYLIIPSPRRVASVVDGQHRILGFDHCAEDRRDMGLLCSVYIDLPQAYQAYLFATININQRKVDKSLAYEQFGYNLDDEDQESWAPDKLAVFFTRRLNLNPDSPLYSHIKIAPLDSDLIFPQTDEKTWQISTASIVEGILCLISSKPKADRDKLHEKPLNERNRTLLPNDGSPFRELYLATNDERLWDIVLKYLKLAEKHLWASASERSYIRKTVGIQALFDVLKYVAVGTDDAGLESILNETLRKARTLDFGKDFFQASGKGRVRIKNCILLKAGLTSESSLPVTDKQAYMDLMM